MYGFDWKFVGAFGFPLNAETLFEFDDWPRHKMYVYWESMWGTCPVPYKNEYNCPKCVFELMGGEIIRYDTHTCMSAG
jgi:hypothetical protein